MQHGSWLIRPIHVGESEAAAAVIRACLKGLNADGLGCSGTDPVLADLVSAYTAPRHLFLVVVDPWDRVLGTGALAPLRGGGEDVCELQKMYLLPDCRGLGLGRTLLVKLLSFAREQGFSLCYLETLAQMEDAARLYRAAGFRPRTGALGATGHGMADRFYEKSLLP